MTDMIARMTRQFGLQKSVVLNWDDGMVEKKPNANKMQLLKFHIIWMVNQID